MESGAGFFVFTGPAIREYGGMGKMKLKPETFARWIENLRDANPAVCMKWFSGGKTFTEVYEYLMQSWSRDEVAGAFMAVQ